jgi:hypothetical protein
VRLFPRRDRSLDGLVRDAIKRANAHAASTAGSPKDVQLLGQISGSRDWAAIHQYWTRRSGLTGGWPRQLAPGELALNLWPIPPGLLHLTTGVGASPQKRQPRTVLGTPALVRWDGNSPTATPYDGLARAVASWVNDVLTENEYPCGVRLAPPILEEWAYKGRLVSRTIVAFDLDWQLPPASDLTWPPA